jgi:hypothetical protein
MESKLSVGNIQRQVWSSQIEICYTRNQPMAGARIEEAFTSKLPVDPRLLMTGSEEPDRKSLLPQWV